LFLGRIHEKKGCDLLIHAFAKAAALDPELQLVIAGPDTSGWKQFLVSLASALGIAEKVHWPGALESDAKWGAFRSAEAFVLPSHQENFGIAVAEALACRKAVLISDKVNIWREIVEDGAGLVGIDTIEGMVSVLATWVNSSARDREIMSNRARETFLHRFEITKTAESLMGILGDVVISRRPAPSEGLRHASVQER
jgi:glycosyltransferase involved in cell wall biosynthesis